MKEVVFALETLIGLRGMEAETGKAPTQEAWTEAFEQAQSALKIYYEID